MCQRRRYSIYEIDRVGRIVIDKPAESSSQNIAQAVNISWSLLNVNVERFPQDSITIFWKRSTENDWKTMVTLGRRNVSYTWKPSDPAAGMYEIYIIADGIDQTGAVGRAVSCLEEGFPEGGRRSFRLISSTTGGRTREYSGASSLPMQGLSSLLTLFAALVAGAAYVVIA